LTLDPIKHAVGDLVEFLLRSGPEVDNGVAIRDIDLCHGGFEDLLLFGERGGEVLIVMHDGGLDLFFDGGREGSFGEFGLRLRCRHRGLLGFSG
jgi:hypothetical protein